MDAPGLVEGSKHISCNDIVADVAEIPKELVIVSLAVSQALLFVVSVTQERLLALGTNKVLHMPVLAQGSDHTLFNGSSTGAADGDAHLVMAAQTIQVTLHLTCLRSQLHTTSGAVEVVRMIRLTTVLQRHVIHNSMTLVADVLPNSSSLLFCIALMAEGSASVLYEALVSKWHLAGFAAETLGVPVVVHGFNDSANDELPTLATARGKQDMEVVLTVLAAFKLVEDSIRKWAEALTANKAGLVPNLAMGVDNLLVGFKPVPTAGTGHRFERHQEVCFSLFCKVDTFGGSRKFA